MAKWLDIFSSQKGPYNREIDKIPLHCQNKSDASTIMYIM